MNALQYTVKFVDDGALDEGRDWVLVNDGPEFYLFVKRSAVRNEQTLSEAWAGFVQLAGDSLAVAV